MNETVGSILGRKDRQIWSLAPDATVYGAFVAVQGDLNGDTQ